MSMSVTGAQPGLVQPSGAPWGGGGGAGGHWSLGFNKRH